MLSRGVSKHREVYSNGRKTHVRVRPKSPFTPERSTNHGASESVTDCWDGDECRTTQRTCRVSYRGVPVPLLIHLPRRPLPPVCVVYTEETRTRTGEQDVLKRLLCLHISIAIITLSSHNLAYAPWKFTSCDTLTEASWVFHRDGSCTGVSSTISYTIHFLTSQQWTIFYLSRRPKLCLISGERR